jgi:dolichol kinase
MLSRWWRLGINVIGPLLVIDVSLSMTTNISSKYAFLPLSIQWLMEFLIEKEKGCERFWGLIYWVGILAIASYPTYRVLSLPSEYKPSVVITRKWFHLLAVLLFAPITCQFPQLMSLSYAIATCILIVLETIRIDMPLVHSLYDAFVDDRKDDSDHIIVSHIFLIIGCAAPLWISEIISNESSLSSSLLLKEFGVICVGIGDAMGAVIGKSVGIHKWGRNQRTLEGSFAMWSSMIGIGVLTCKSMQDFWSLLLATTFTTILEAFTVQLDNFVLPISGSIILLLTLTPSS